MAAELLARVRALLARHYMRRQFATLPAETPDEITAEPTLAAAAPTLLALATAPLAAVASAQPEASEQLAQWQKTAAAHLANEHFGLAELARLLGLSERTLYRRLGELAGLTPAAWLRELCLNQARDSCSKPATLER